MTHLPSGHTIRHMQGEELLEQQRNFKGYDIGLMKLSPGGCVLPDSFRQFADDIYNFEVMNILIYTLATNTIILSIYKL